MAKTTRDIWNPLCLSAPLFAPLAHLASEIDSKTDWPSLNDYQTILNGTSSTLITQNGKPVHAVTQGEQPKQFAEHYEPRIFLTGELQTRLENWHDFFQILVWRTFPQTKIQINARHYDAASTRRQHHPTQGNRTPLENALTLFDECGAILVASNPQLFELVRDHRWKELFWENRAAVQSQFRCVIFGHALYEKALTPYIGMTAHCLLLDVDQSLIDKPIDALVSYCDTHIARCFVSPNAISSPRDLTPFPLLGMPGWFPDNEQVTFYDDSNYFRPKRAKPPGS